MPSMRTPAAKSSGASTAVRGPPYDSPKRNLGDVIRLLTLSQRTMKSRITAASASTLQKLRLLKGAIAVDRPVPTALTKTRSLVSSRLSALATIAKGRGAVVRGTPVARRRGP